MAKMISEFALQIVEREPQMEDVGCRDFNDIDTENQEMVEYMQLSCDLRLMGMEANGDDARPFFDANSCMTRAEFGTILSRLLFGDTYNYDESEPYVYGSWYIDHLNTLKKLDIMTMIEDPWPTFEERRSFVIIMMYRTFKQIDVILDMWIKGDGASATEYEVGE